jgi:uncharacterized protein (TIGR01244 family)
MNRKTLADGITVSAQLDAADFIELARQGVTLVINNRPDGEVPGQPNAAEGEQAAAKAGLAYRHIPMTFATLQAAEIDQFGDAVASASGPVHAHCASGARSANLWALSMIRRGAMTREDACHWAQDHGADLSAGFTWLDQHPQ